MADLLATEDFRRGVVLSLVSGVAQAYFELQELDLELEIARRTTESFTETVALFTRRFLGGVDSKLSVERAKAALGAAAAAIPQLEQQIVIKENQICILLGRPPGPIARAAAADPGRRCRRRRRPGCPPSCCCAVPTSCRPSSRSPRPTRRSASRWRTSSRASA